jgi:uncharacterized protein with GYD domain
MSPYVILSRLSPEVFKDPKGLKQRAATVADKIKAKCPAVTWKDSYLTLGRFDVVDVVESDNLKQLEKAALIIRAWPRHHGDPARGSLERVHRYPLATSVIVARRRAPLSRRYRP